MERRQINEDNNNTIANHLTIISQSFIFKTIIQLPTKMSFKENTYNDLSLFYIFSQPFHIFFATIIKSCFDYFLLFFLEVSISKMNKIVFYY